MQKKIAVITLGCSKNLVDSERLMKMLADVGYEVTDAASEEFIDSEGEKIVVVNTCGFIRRSESTRFFEQPSVMTAIFFCIIDQLALITAVLCDCNMLLLFV